MSTEPDVNTVTCIRMTVVQVELAVADDGSERCTINTSQKHSERRRPQNFIKTPFILILSVSPPAHSIHTVSSRHIIIKYHTVCIIFSCHLLSLLLTALISIVSACFPIYAIKKKGKNKKQYMLANMSSLLLSSQNKNKKLD